MLCREENDATWIPLIYLHNDLCNFKFWESYFNLNSILLYSYFTSNPIFRLSYFNLISILPQSYSPLSILAIAYSDNLTSIASQSYFTHKITHIQTTLLQSYIYLTLFLAHLSTAYFYNLISILLSFSHFCDCKFWESYFNLSSILLSSNLSQYYFSLISNSDLADLISSL